MDAAGASSIIRPRYNTRMRSHKRRTTDRLWLMNIIDRVISRSQTLDQPLDLMRVRLTRPVIVKGFNGVKVGDVVRISIDEAKQAQGSNPPWGQVLDEFPKPTRGIEDYLVEKQKEQDIL